MGEKKRGTILVVDDQIGIRALLCEVFQKEGYEVYKTDNKEDALKIFNEKTPNLVILDKKIPGTNGIEILKQMKEKRPETLAIMMTAYAELNGEFDEEALNYGAEVFIKKPFDINEVRNIVNEMM